MTTIKDTYSNYRSCFKENLLYPDILALLGCYTV